MDHPNNRKRSGACIYYKESLGIKALDAPSINECLLCELSVQSKRRYINVMNRSRSQNNDEFDEFLNSFEILLSNIANLVHYLLQDPHPGGLNYTI